MAFGFQNPGDGYPCHISENHYNGRITVEPDEDFDGDVPTPETLDDIDRMNRAIRRCTDIHDAIDILIRDFGADIC